jgi:hypothetical protein
MNRSCEMRFDDCWWGLDKGDNEKTRAMVCVGVELKLGWWCCVYLRGNFVYRHRIQFCQSTFLPYQFPVQKIAARKIDLITLPLSTFC